MKINLKYDKEKWLELHWNAIWTDFDIKNFLQKIIIDDIKDWERIYFWVYYSFEENDGDLVYKLVFWLQNEKNLKINTIETFNKYLKNFSENIFKYTDNEKILKIYKENKKFLDSFLDWKIFWLQNTFLSDINCWSFKISNFVLSTYSFEIFDFIEAIFSYFYNAFFEIDLKEKDIFIENPTDKYWKEIIFKDENNDEYLPYRLKESKDEKIIKWRKIKKSQLENVILNDSLKKNIEWIVKIFKNKEHYKKWNAEAPKWIMLFWPPGTWKTTVAKVIAVELWMNFESISSSDIVSKRIWDSARNMKNFFELLKPNTVVFIDEIDSLLPDRWNIWAKNWHQDSERLSVVTTFLEYLDWMKTLEDVLFIWATNNIDQIDKAILRPWRFDYKLLIALPDKKSRKKIWELYLKKAEENISYKIIWEDFNFEKLSEITEWFSWADIKEIVRRVMSEYADLSLEHNENFEVNSEKTYKFILSWIEKFVEENSKNEWIIISEKYLQDVILNKSLKQEIEILVKRYKNKEHFKKWNSEEPKWIILYWPPGTGKTTIAKVIASELWLRFYSLSSSEIVSKWVWESAQKMDEFLKNIKPKSIVFIDEIETLLRDREESDKHWKNEERNSVVTTFLEYLDGMKTLKDVFFIGATNNIESVDKAVLRPGRFDSKLYIWVPDKDSRKKLWELYLKKAETNIFYKIFDETIDLNYLAEISNNFTWADIKEIIRRIMSDYALWSLTLKKAEFNAETTYRWLIYNIEKFKEETSTDKWIIPEKEKLYLKDIWWQQKLKEEIKKIITQLKNKEIFEEFWVEMPKWLLLYWPPWTGKTLTAKVIANECNILFYMLTAKDFSAQNWIEEFEEKLKKLLSPSIIFIDEIDAIWRKRELSSHYDVKILNTFLQKLDWFVWSENMFFIGATNNIDILDDALTRAWRFDLKILVDLPDFEGRKDIFKIYIEKSKTKKWKNLFKENIDYDTISSEAESFVWADIKEIIRRLKQKLTLKIIEESLTLEWNELETKDILEEIKDYKKEKDFWNKKKIWFEY